MQPLHVGYASDKGGNTIEVHWYRRKANLHHVRTAKRKYVYNLSIKKYKVLNFRFIQIWDSNIIETAEADLYNSELEGMVDAIKKNITVLMNKNGCSQHVCYKVFLTC